MANMMTFSQSNIAFYEELLLREDYQGAISRNIALSSTPRSGSTFFAQVLSESGAFGMPKEWFGKKQIQAFCIFAGMKEADFDLQNYMNFIYRIGQQQYIFGKNSCESLGRFQEARY